MSAEDKWFIQIGSNYQGPLSRLEIKELVASGIAGTRPLVWTKGYQAWIYYDESPIYENAPPPLPSPHLGPKIISIQKKLSQPSETQPFSMPISVTPSLKEAVVIRSENDLTLFKKLEAEYFDDRTSTIDSRELKKAKQEAKEFAEKNNHSTLSISKIFIAILAIAVVIFLLTKVK